MQALSVRPSLRVSSNKTSRVAMRRSVAAKAKYGEDSIYFDLNDMANTSGSWDMYGQDDKKRYNDMQNMFFERAATSLARREAMFSFCALSGAAAILVFGAKGSKDADLPIIKGPQQPAQVGPRGRI